MDGSSEIQSENERKRDEVLAKYNALHSMWVRCNPSYNKWFEELEKVEEICDGIFLTYESSAQACTYLFGLLLPSALSSMEVSSTWKFRFSCMSLAGLVALGFIPSVWRISSDVAFWSTRRSDLKRKLATLFEEDVRPIYMANKLVGPAPGFLTVNDKTNYETMQESTEKLYRHLKSYLEICFAKISYEFKLAVMMFTPFIVGVVIGFIAWRLFLSL